ncbi:MAG: hypothetical protein KDE09_13145 [Anaerolineales bacterium]|nr:hypothetical protein [Anaerolineales bacterium]MCB8962754.1 hypothetical protein [Ardenticatenales bacterium]
MPYRHASAAEDYAAYAAGHILYARPGQTAFPIRLTDEIWGRCLALRRQLDLPDKLLTVFDPCCGGAYQLTTLALRHGEQISQICAADVDAAALALARQNLGLLTPAGLDARAQQLRALYEAHGKVNHVKALAHLPILQARQAAIEPLSVNLFAADGGQPDQLLSGLAGTAVDLVLSDVPYGQKAAWGGSLGTEPADPLHALLTALQSVINPQTILALAMSKDQRAAHPAYRQLGRFQIGKRRIQFLQPLS